MSAFASQYAARASGALVTETDPGSVFFKNIF